MSWEPLVMVVDMRQGQLYHALVVCQNAAGEQAGVHLSPKTGGRTESAEPSLTLALAAAGYAQGVAARLAAPRPGGVKLLVDGREQENLSRYGEVLRRVEELADAYSDEL